MEIIKILVKIITKSICVKLDKTCLSTPKHPHLSPTLPLIIAQLPAQFTFHIIISITAIVIFGIFKE